MGRTKFVVAGAVALLLPLVAPSPASAEVVPLVQSTTITIPNVGNATPYPSSIQVDGTSDVITNVEVVIPDIDHTAPRDLDVLLVGPTGASVVLTSDNGDLADAVNVALRFKDGSPAVPTPMVSGTFAPTNTGAGDPFPAPAPAAAPAANLAVFNGTSPIGTWNLFVVDDQGGDTGTFTGGWRLELTLASGACINRPEDGFTDVTPANIHEPAIDCLVSYSVASGTSATTFNPSGNVSRAQMASFVARAIAATGTTLPASPPDAFTDDTGSTHELRINQLKAMNVIGSNGESGASYFPEGEMRRDHMASYMFEAFEAVTGAPLPAGPNAFNDDNGNAHEVAINALAAEGVITGTGGGNFNPNGTVSRAQMGSFLARFLQLLDEKGALPG
jgi:subtilisin-like proprotein convertase family protein